MTGKRATDESSGVVLNKARARLARQLNNGAAAPLPSISLAELIEDIPRLTPLQMFDQTSHYGYVGQEEARRGICLGLYRHIDRARRIFLDKVPRSKLPLRENILLMGPTGSGKTYLLRLLLEKILRIPWVIEDASRLTESGYVGDDAGSILGRLIRAAGPRAALSRIGCIYLDEADKLAACSGINTRFAGAGTSKDLKLGVQRELLAITDPTGSDIPTQMDEGPFAKRISFNCADMLLIAGGCFSGLNQLILDKREAQSIGFGGSVRKREDESIQVSYLRSQCSLAGPLATYGWLPELTARFGKVLCMKPHDEITLMEIFERNVLARYETELSLHGVTLRVEEDVKNAIVAASLERETGARGLNALSEHLEEACFELYSEESGTAKALTLYQSGGGVKWDITRRRITEGITLRPPQKLQG